MAGLFSAARARLASFLGAFLLVSMLAAPGQAQAPGQTSAATYDLTQLNSHVSDAVLQARDAEQRAVAAAQAARDAAATALNNGVMASGGSGMGVFDAENGDRYAGQWAGGHYNGYGVYTWSPGAPLGTLRYEGGYVNDRSNGYGISYKSDGRRIVGSRTDGHVTGYFVQYNEGGWRQYEGQVVNGNLNGSGVEWDAQGHIVSQGVWTNGDLTAPLTR